MAAASRSAAERRRRATTAAAVHLPAFAARLVSLGAHPDEAAAIAARLEHRWQDCYEPLEDLYGSDGRADAVIERCLDLVAAAAATRPAEQRRLDRRREIRPDWFQDEAQVGYVCYVDRFGGTLEGVRRQVEYLAELGVTYLHLMPLLQPRPCEDDGGYAVMDYRAVDDRLGTMEDLSGLASDLRQHGISLCVDLVVNHTAREHEWARKAAAGDPRYRAYYLIFPDREWPDRYEASLPEVFPDRAPGSFTWSDEVGGWVWTTFHDYQWDLDYTNPDVFAEMLDVMCFLANQGVEILRLDAAPFLWKHEGTNCQNQPEAHALLQAFRALVSVVAPAVLFKAEAIVAPTELVPYLGARTDGRRYRECDLAYHNQLMVMGWSSLATRDARLVTQALARMIALPPDTSWVTYVRGHDDIGWAVTDEDASAVGWGGDAHRRFLADFYAGDFPRSFADGRRFQEDPATGDARTSGMTATLCGITRARREGDEDALERGIRRLLLLYGLAASFGGIPLIYMGDEIALGDDPAWHEHPEQAQDNRWAHRPPMDWSAAARRHDPGSVEGRVFAGLAGLLAARRATPEMRAGGSTHIMWHDHPAVLAYHRHHARQGSLLVLASCSEVDVTVDPSLPGWSGLREPVDVLAPTSVLHAGDGRIHMPALGLRWLVER